MGFSKIALKTAESIVNKAEHLCPSGATKKVLLFANNSSTTETIAKTTERAALNSKVVQAKTVQNVTTSATQDLTKIPELKLLPNSKYNSYTPETQEIITKFREWAFKSTRKFKNPDFAFNNIDNFILNLVRYCDNEKFISNIFKYSKLFNEYTEIKVNLNKSFNKIKNFNSKITTNLALMKLFNRNSYINLSNSKGFNEIINGRLSISYLKDIKPTDKIGKNYFYELFNNIEKATNKRLINSGLDVKKVNEYLKGLDEEICKNPEFVNNFITSLEEIKNPNLANSIMRKFNFDKDFFNFENEFFSRLITLAKEEPKLVEKALKIEKSNPYSITHIVEIFKDTNNFKISDKLFEDYLKFEKTNPECCIPMTLNQINKFLQNCDADENLVRGIFKNATNFSKTTGEIEFGEIFSFANSKNLELLKSWFKTGKISTKDWFKYWLQGRYPALTSTEIANLHNQIYLPLRKAGLSDKVASTVIHLKLDNPATFKVLEDTKILDLIKEKKVNPRILNSFRRCKQGELLPEVISDTQKLLRGESLIKKFSSTKDVLRNTSAGDVVSVNGKMYINNNGKLESWNMTEENFNKLFPLVDRFSTIQGFEDCYLISVLNSIYQNPKTRAQYYKMFKQKGNDILVTIPAYKDFKGTTRFIDGKVVTNANSDNAAPHIQMLEHTYSRVALRSAKETPQFASGENPLITQNTDFLSERISGGLLDTVLKEILPTKKLKEFWVNTTNDKEKIEYLLKNFGADSRYIITEGHQVGTGMGHAISVKSYEPKSKTVTIVDPYVAGIQSKMSLKDFLEHILNLTITRVG